MSRKDCDCQQGYNMMPFILKPLLLLLVFIKYEQLQTSLAMLHGRVASTEKKQYYCCFPVGTMFPLSSKKV